MIGERTAYTVVNHVIEFSVRGEKWVTWPDPGRQDALSALDDEAAILAAFAEILKTRHNPATGIRYRLVHRTAVIDDIVMAEELPDGTVAVPAEHDH